MCRRFRNFLKNVCWNTLLQCSLLNKVHNWVQGFPILIQLNIKTRRFWGGWETRHLPPSLSIFSSWSHSFPGLWYVLFSKDVPPLPPQRFLPAGAQTVPPHRICIGFVMWDSPGAWWLIKASQRHLECFLLPCHVPLLAILCLLKPHPPLKNTFPLVLFQSAVWSNLVPTCYCMLLSFLRMTLLNTMHRMSHRNSRPLTLLDTPSTQTITNYAAHKWLLIFRICYK